MSCSVLFGLKHAIEAARKESGVDEHFAIGKNFDNYTKFQKLYILHLHFTFINYSVEYKITCNTLQWNIVQTVEHKLQKNCASLNSS